MTADGRLWAFWDPQNAQHHVPPSMVKPTSREAVVGLCGEGFARFVEAKYGAKAWGGR